MATYKFVDGDQLDIDLTAVSDAIRTKGETAEQLSFPDGMVAAISAISTGVELDFAVTGGTEQPSDPAANTIWVNTETEITSWIFSPAEPESPVEGMVWIMMGTSGDVAFNALKRNEIQIYPVSAEQYVGGVWVSVEAHIYQEGTWTELVGSLVLFDGTDGGDNTELTGGWSVISQTSQAKLEVTSEQISFLSASAGTVRRAGPVKSLDLSKYKTLYCDGLNASTSDSDSYSFMLLAERTNSAEPVATVRQPFGTRGVVAIDLTAIASRDALYFAISNASGSVGSKLFRCWADHREMSVSQMQSELQAAYQEGVNTAYDQ